VGCHTRGGFFLWFIFPGICGVFHQKRIKKKGTNKLVKKEGENNLRPRNRWSGEDGHKAGRSLRMALALFGRHDV
jgi:hypothetical protein